MRLLATALVALISLGPAAAQTTSWDAATGVWTFDGSAVAVTVEVALTCDGGLLALNGAPESAPCADVQRLHIQTGPGDDVVELGASFVPGSGFGGSTIAVGDGDNTVALADRHDAPAEVTGGAGDTAVSASVGTVSVSWDVGPGSKYTIDATGTALVDAYLRGSDNLDQLSCLVSDPTAGRVFVGWPDVQSGVEMPANGRVEVDLGAGDDLWSNRTCLDDVGGVTFDVDAGDGDDRVTLTGSGGDDQFTIGAGTPACAGVSVDLRSGAPTPLQTCLSNVEGYEIYGNGGDTEIVGDPASTLADALVGTTWFVLPSGDFTVSGLAPLGPAELWETILTLAESCDVDLPLAGWAELWIDLDQGVPCNVAVPPGGRVAPQLLITEDASCVMRELAGDPSIECRAWLGGTIQNAGLETRFVDVGPGPSASSFDLTMITQNPERAGTITYRPESISADTGVRVRLVDDFSGPVDEYGLVFDASKGDFGIARVELEQVLGDEGGLAFRVISDLTARDEVIEQLIAFNARWSPVEVQTSEGTDVYAHAPGAGLAYSFRSGSGSNRGGPGDSLIVASGGASYTDDGSTIVVEGHGPINYAGFGVVEVRDAFATAAEPVAAAEGLRLTARPNPSAGAVALDLALDAPGPVRVTVLDMLGRTVARVWDGPLGAGVHALTWDAAAVAPGVYAVRVETDRLATALMVTVAR